MAGHCSKVREDIIQIDPKRDIQQFHITNMGKLIELNEADIRSDIHGLYINKSKQIIDTGRLKAEYQSDK